MDLIKPLPVEVTDADGLSHQFIVSRLPATIGREIVAKYTSSAIPKAGEYSTSQEAMLKMMQFVAVEIDGAQVRLKTQALVDNHVPDAEALLRLEIEMLKHNTSFFGRAGSQGLLGFLLSKLEALAPKIMQTLTASLPPSSPKDTPPSQS